MFSRGNSFVFTFRMMLFVVIGASESRHAPNVALLRWCARGVECGSNPVVMAAGLVRARRLVVDWLLRGLHSGEPRRLQRQLGNLNFVFGSLLRSDYSGFLLLAFLDLFQFFLLTLGLLDPRFLDLFICGFPPRLRKLLPLLVRLLLILFMVLKFLQFLQFPFELLAREILAMAVLHRARGIQRLFAAIGAVESIQAIDMRRDNVRCTRWIVRRGHADGFAPLPKALAALGGVARLFVHYLGSRRRGRIWHRRWAAAARGSPRGGAVPSDAVSGHPLKTFERRRSRRSFCLRDFCSNLGYGLHIQTAIRIKNAG
mmetsp:Transcript_30760/g.57466  ORF Transcript_30760/g.57466 Transcript_30760/m.57466 type:complete len:314 (-) Transcript_30760:174-1115(-)